MSARTTQQRTQDYPQAGKAAGDYGFHPLRVLVRRRWQLFACLVIVGSIAFASLFLSQPKYRAVAQVHVTERGAQQGKLSDLMGRGGRSGGDYFTTQCELLQSQYVLTRAAQRITEGGGAGASRNDTVEWMRDRIKIQPVPGSHLIDIIGIGSSAEEAAVVANGVMQAFVETAVTRQELNNTRIVERIRNQISDFDREVEKKKDSLNRFRQDHRIAGPEDSVSSAQARISQWQQDLHQTRTKRLELEPRQEQLRNLLRIDAAWTGGGDQWPGVQNR